MTSKVFFQFGSQKDPQVISFDGTGITVFELKREIISASGLGDGTDFDLYLYHKDNQDDARIIWSKLEEYNDDTEIVPRGTTVLARRLPASKPGYGRAARYVSGRAPVTAKNAYRTEATKQNTTTMGGITQADVNAAINSAQTEEEKIAAMFAAGGDQWEQQQKKMASAKPVHFKKGKPQNVPDHEPPPGYICYRCHQKGHWIQACPTNDDPNFENRPRVKRTTGIPKSMLKVVEKPVEFVNDGFTDEKRLPSGVMYNENGEQVVAVPDEKAWQQFQAKANAAAVKQEEVEAGSQEIRERGLECEIDKRLFLEPTKTPCCGKTYCHECIENALINSDLVCPSCGTDGVIIDHLEPDTEMSQRIADYEAEKAAERRAKEEEQAQSPPKSPAQEAAVTSEPSDEAKPESGVDEAKPASRSPSPPKSPGKSAGNSPSTAAATPAADSEEVSKKRKADDEADTDQPIPTAPAAMRNQPQPKPQAPSTNNDEFIKQMNAMAGMPSNNNSHGGNGAMPNNMQDFNNGAFMPPFPNMMGGFSQNNGMNMAMNNGMMNFPPNGMMNPMMMQNWNGMNGMGPMGNGANGMGFTPNNMYGANNMGYQNGFNQGYGNNQSNNWHGNNNYNNRGNWNNHMGGHVQQQNFQGGRGGPAGNFPNQQSLSNEEDNAYFRKPVNPHRHQNRAKRLRPTEYTEL